MRPSSQTFLMNILLRWMNEFLVRVLHISIERDTDGKSHERRSISRRPTQGVLPAEFCYAIRPFHTSVKQFYTMHSARHGEHLTLKRRAPLVKPVLSVVRMQVCSVCHCWSQFARSAESGAAVNDRPRTQKGYIIELERVASGEFWVLGGALQVLALTSLNVTLPHTVSSQLLHSY